MKHGIKKYPPPKKKFNFHPFYVNLQIEILKVADLSNIE